MANEQDLVRVNTRISKTLNTWLDEKAKETGMSKSSIIMMATENYMRENMAFSAMADMNQLVAKLDELEKAVKRIDPTE